MQRWNRWRHPRSNARDANAKRARSRTSRRYKDAARDDCAKVADEIARRYPKATVRFALVVYRDFSDSERFETLDFVTDRPS